MEEERTLAPRRKRSRVSLRRRRSQVAPRRRSLDGIEEYVYSGVNEYITLI